MIESIESLSWLQIIGILAGVVIFLYLVEP